MVVAGEQVILYPTNKATKSGVMDQTAVVAFVCTYYIRPRVVANRLASCLSQLSITTIAHDSSSAFSKLLLRLSDDLLAGEGFTRSWQCVNYERRSRLDHLDLCTGSVRGVRVVSDFTMRPDITSWRGPEA